MPQAVSWLQTTDVGWVRSDLVLTVPLTSIARLSVLVLASDYVGNYSVWSITDVAENYSTTALAVIGSPMRVTQHNNTAGASAWDVRLVATGADLRVDVYGAASKTIDWHVDVDVSLLITRKTTTSNLLTNLVAYWRLDETSDGSVPVTRVDSTTTSNLTDNNTVASITGLIGNAGTFVRANSEFLSAADNASLNMAGTTDFTCTCWVKFNSLAVKQSLICKGNTLGTLVDYELRWDGTLAVFTAGAVTVTSSFSASIGTGVYYFVTFGFTSSSNTWSISVNNGTVDSAVATPQGANTFPFNIGAFGNTFNFADADIDEVGLWKRLLTSAEKTTLYNGGLGLTYPFS